LMYWGGAISRKSEKL